MISQYMLIGQPVAHSLSPVIHHLFGELTQRRLHYSLVEATPETFRQSVLDWRGNKGQGCNVTIPFKEQAVACCDRLTREASQAQAVNTILMHRDGALVGHNTDGLGLCTDLTRNLHQALSGQRVLILGAGGATRGVLGPLLAERPGAVHIANRTLARAEALASAFDEPALLSASTLDDLPGLGAFDLIIHATSLGLDGQSPALPESLFHADTLAYDMMYGSADTAFMATAHARGAGQVASGLGMLIEQAADAFLFWEGVRPKTRMVFPRLRQHIKEHS